MALQTNGLIIPRNMYLRLSIFNINGGSLESTASIVNKLKEMPVEFKERKYYEGFSDVDTDGNMISVYYTIGQPVNVQVMKDGAMKPQVIYSQGQCEYIIHVKEKYLECRGTSWVARRGLLPLTNMLGVEFTRVSLDENAMTTLCRDASMVKTVRIANLENPSLSRIELSGEILDSAEWSIYRRQGTIRYFKGYLDLPTGAKIDAEVTNKGSIVIYKHGIGIPAEDVIATVNMIKKLAQN